MFVMASLEILKGQFTQITSFLPSLKVALEQL